MHGKIIVRHQAHGKVQVEEKPYLSVVVTMNKLLPIQM